MKTTYYLFGEDACRIFKYWSTEERTSVENVVNAKVRFETYRFGSLDGDDNPTDLLLAFQGWGDFTELTEEEFNQFKNHTPR